MQGQSPLKRKEGPERTIIIETEGICYDLGVQVGTGAQGPFTLSDDATDHPSPSGNSTGVGEPPKELFYASQRGGRPSPCLNKRKLLFFLIVALSRDQVCPGQLRSAPESLSSCV